MTNVAPMEWPTPQGDRTEVLPPMDFGAMLRVIWQGKWQIIAITLLVTAITAYYAFRIASPRYAATARVQLDTVLTDTGLGLTGAGFDDVTINTKLSQVTSPQVLGDVVQALGLLEDPEWNRSLTPDHPRSLRSLRTRARHLLAGTQPTPPDQAAIMDKTIKNLAGSLTVTRKPDTYIMTITAQSGDPQKAALLADVTAQRYLAARDAQLAQARARADDWLVARVNALRDQLKTQGMALAQLIATPQLQEDRGLDTISAQILAVDQALAAARSALAIRDGAPDRNGLRDAPEMAQLRDNIADLDALKNRLGTQLSAQSAGLAQLHQLRLQADATRQLYQTMLDRLHASRLAQGLERSAAARIISDSDGRYIGPQKIPLVTLGAVTGGVLGLLMVFVLHQMRRGFIDVRRLRIATGLPVLGQIGDGPLRHLRRARGPFPIAKDSPLDQPIQDMMTMLPLTIRQGPAQVIVVTSSVAGEGKTANALMLAHGLARSDKKVLLIAGDGSSPLLTQVVGKADIVQAQMAWQHNQPVVTLPRIGADLLGVGALQGWDGVDHLTGRMTELRQAYDHIVIDTPPVLQDPAARVLAAQGDAVIHAVRWLKTPRGVTLQALDALAAAECPATGLTLNHINMRKMRQLSQDPSVGMTSGAMAL